MRRRATCSAGARHSSRRTAWSGRTRAKTGRSCPPHDSTCASRCTSRSSGTRLSRWISGRTGKTRDAPALPLGIPRQGPPARIFATDTDVTFIYRAGVDGAGGYAEHRMIAIDGKPHDPRRTADYTYMGYTVGKWEGDTLVLDSIGFSDETWLSRGGFFHTDQMRAIEKFTRLRRPAHLRRHDRGSGRASRAVGLPTRVMRRSPTNTIVGERGSCTDSEQKEAATQYRH